MSQYPPYQPPGGYPPPPGMYPQAGGYPGYSAARTSGMAVTSLILGLLLCIPGLTGLLAIIFGLFGIGATKDPLVRGRGMAIAGLLLGLINFALWGGGAEAYWKDTAPMRAISRQFINDLSAANPSVANDCSSKITADQLKTAAAWFAQQGPVQKVQAWAFGNQNQAQAGAPAACLGRITFTNGQRSGFQFTLIYNQGAWKVDTFNFH
jgi:uncharacterized protein DUF4190